MSVSLAILSSINEAKNDLKVSDLSGNLEMYSVQNGGEGPVQCYRESSINQT